MIVPVSDRGAAHSLGVVLMTPVLLVLGCAVFQAAMWSHARTQARIIARDAAGLVARAQVAPAEAGRLALQGWETDGLLSDVRFRVDLGVERIAVRLDARAPGILRGTSVPVRVDVDLPREGWRP